MAENKEAIVVIQSEQQNQLDIQQKNQLIKTFFQGILNSLKEFNLKDSSPSVFLIYAHDSKNKNDLPVNANEVELLIQWLYGLGIDLYSDRRSQHVDFSTQTEKELAMNLLKNQFNILPDDKEKRYQHIILCGSQLLQSHTFKKSQSHPEETYFDLYRKQITDALSLPDPAYIKISKLQRKLNHYWDEHKDKAFHHVLTELAFLDLRLAEPELQSSVIPIILNGTTDNALPFFVSKLHLNVKTTWSSSAAQSTTNEVYSQEGLHHALFHILRCLYVGQENELNYIRKCEQDYTDVIESFRENKIYSQNLQIALKNKEENEQNTQSKINHIFMDYSIKGVETPDVLSDRVGINEVVAALLQRRYKEPAFAELKRLLYERTFPITESFINLAIVKEHEQKTKEDDQLNENKQLKDVMTLHRDDYINSFEMIYQPKQPIKLKELFSPTKDENKAPKRHLIEGRAGIGKTTLCQYLVHQWAVDDDKLKAWSQQFDWVIHISLRMFSEVEQQDFTHLTLIHWLYEQYLTKAEQQQIREAELTQAFEELNSQGKVLLLLDGYDEIVPLLKSNQSFQDFFDHQLLACSYWLLFSRPYYFTSNSPDRRLENIGFTKEDIPKYVQQFFCDIEKEKGISQQVKVDSLISYLKQNPNAMGIAHIPINLELLCSAWEAGNKLNNQLTLTELYDHLVLSLFGRYLHKFYPQTFSSASGIMWEDIKEDEDYQCQQMLAFLQALAWHQMQQPGLIIHAEFIKKLVRHFYPGFKQQPQREIFGETVLKQLGLLKGCDVHKSTLEQSYYFIHLTFQEYFAARYIVSCWKGNQPLVGYASIQALIAQEKFNPRYEIVWWMVAGLLKDDKPHLEAFFDYFKETPRDLNGLSQQLLQMRCLEECQLCLGESRKVKLLTGLLNRINYEVVSKPNYGVYFIATYLGMSPQVFHQKPMDEWFTASLRDEHKVRRSLIILAKQPSLPPWIIEQLIVLLSDEDTSVSKAAANALAQQRLLSKSDIQRLVALLSDEDNGVSDAAAKALGQQRSLPENVCLQLVVLLSDEETNSGSAAAYALEQQKSLSETVCLQLVALLSDERNVGFIVAALARQSSLPESVVQQLVALLSNKAWPVKSAAADVLGQQSTLSERVVQRLAELLSDEARLVKSIAAKALGQQKSLPERIVQQLVALLSDKAWQVKSAAAKALGQQRLLPENACLQLVALLSDEVWIVRAAAIEALGQQMLLSESVVLRLVALLSDEEWIVIASAIETFGQKSKSTWSENAWLQLVALLSNKAWPVKSAVADVLGQKSTWLESIVQRLEALLSNEAWEVRFAGAEALGLQRLLPERVCLQLAVLLRDEERKVRLAAAQALGQQKSSLLESVVQRLEAALLSDKKREVRVAAARALVQQKSLPESVVKRLVALLSDEAWGVRHAYASALNQQSVLPIKILNILGILAIADLELTVTAIEKLSVEFLMEVIKKQISSDNLVPLLRLLFIKSQQQKLPIYFIDHEQASDELNLVEGESKLHIGNECQAAFTRQQKKQFIKEFNQVFLEMTDILPELSSGEFQDFKNHMAGQMLSQARVLFQAAKSVSPISYIANEEFIKRIMFFTPAGRVLENSQQEKIIADARERKTLQVPEKKEIFWQSVGIINSQK